MAQTGAIVDKLLTRASNMLVPEGYISEVLFPNIQSVQTTGKFGKYGNEHLRIQNNTLMKGRGEAPRVEVVTRSTQLYDIERHGVEGLVTKDDYKNVEEPFEAEEDEVMALTTALWLGKEKAMADSLTSTSVITQNATLSGTDQWDDYTNSDPLGDFATAHTTIYDACGRHPNTAVMSRATLNKLKYHPSILDALGFKHNRVGLLTIEDIARAMDVKRLLISEAVYNSSNKGQADSIAPVWGKDVLFAHIAPRPDKRQQSLGYYLTERGESPRKVYKYEPGNPPGARAIIVEDSYDYLLTNVACAYLYKAAIS